MKVDPEIKKFEEENKNGSEVTTMDETSEVEELYYKMNKKGQK